MGAKVSRDDFEWTTSKQIHSARSKEILKKYPQIKKLFGAEPKLKWIVSGLVLIQLGMLFVIPSLSWSWTIVLAYCCGAFINHWLLLAIHETSHGTAFGHSRPLANRILGICANLPVGIPFSAPYKKYHLSHHKYLGDEVLDPGMPTYFEAKLFCNTGGKLLWIFLMPVVQGLRALLLHPSPLTQMEVINIITQLSFDTIVYYYFGGKALTYLIAGSFFSLGLHPMALHILAEHYSFHKGIETYSYYGPMNAITFNIFYHNEHHDFPAVPYSRLPEVRAIASEYYDNLPQHESLFRVYYDFITDPALGPYANIRRPNKSDAAKKTL